MEQISTEDFQVIERFPDTERARRAQREKEAIMAGN